MNAAGWKALSMLANLALIVALVASIGAGSALAGWLTVVPLIALSAYAEWRADKARPP